MDALLLVGVIRLYRLLLFMHLPYRDSGGGVGVLPQGIFHEVDLLPAGAFEEVVR